MPDYSDLVPSQLKPAWSDGTDLKPSLTTSNYSGGTPAAANEVKPSLLKSDGSLKDSMLSGGQLKASASNALSLAGIVADAAFFYAMQDNAASTAIVDSSGNAANGTLAGGGTTADISTTGPGGEYASALNFGGAGIYVAGPTTNFTVAPLAVSFAGWMKTTQSGIRYFMGSGNASTSTYYCALNHSTGVPRFYFRNSDGSQQTLITGSGNVDNGTWNHFAVTIDPDAITLYLNGVVTGTPAAPPSTNLTSNVFTIGGFRLPSATVVDADICGAGLWSRVLTASEVATLAGAAS